MSSNLYSQFDPLAIRIKHQHYVPECYLKRFCNENGGLCVLDKKGSYQFISSPRGVANEIDFYQIGIGSENNEDLTALDDLQIVERGMGEIESDYAKASAFLIEEAPYLGVKSELMVPIARHMAMQDLRTAKARHSFDEQYGVMMASVNSDLMKEHFGDEVDQYRIRVAKSHKAAHHISAIFTEGLLPAITDILLEHIWIVAIASPDSFFITSDHPVARRPYITGQRESFSGLKSAGIEISFPLTPKLCLILRERSFHRKHAEHHLKAIELPRREVLILNRMQCVASRRWLYSHTGEFPDLDLFMSKHPFTRQVDGDESECNTYEVSRDASGSRDLVHMRGRERNIRWTDGV